MPHRHSATRLRLATIIPAAQQLRTTIAVESAVKLVAAEWAQSAALWPGDTVRVHRATGGGHGNCETVSAAAAALWRGLRAGGCGRSLSQASRVQSDWLMLTSQATEAAGVASWRAVAELSGTGGLRRAGSLTP